MPHHCTVPPALSGIPLFVTPLLSGKSLPTKVGGTKNPSFVTPALAGIFSEENRNAPSPVTPALAGERLPTEVGVTRFEDTD